MRRETVGRVMLLLGGFSLGLLERLGQLHGAVLLGVGKLLGVHLTAVGHLLLVLRLGHGHALGSLRLLCLLRGLGSGHLLGVTLGLHLHLHAVALGDHHRVLAWAALGL